MNLALWVLALAIFVFAEKTFPGRLWITPGAGVVLHEWGAWGLLRAAGAA